MAEDNKRDKTPEELERERKAREAKGEKGSPAENAEEDVNEDLE